eukprot:CAMPEP_0168475708 /NCGR_PEP_ID=MMETSP0228-20121227/61502_1 /TAXON_ID=133427 /ORGANISM="Protoceratium reticulatum, Strain CCCM 535 (=CCMP 1889)" /LENGTH=45 /DNA_ID= /DNA_START= /DNA_END= /DNA_ORIENTATION=
MTFLTVAVVDLWQAFKMELVIFALTLAFAFLLKGGPGKATAKKTG